MSKRTSGLIGLAAAAILGIDRSAAAQDPTIADHHERPHHNFRIGKPHRTVEGAVQGGMRRLSMPRCQRLFEEFTDQGGRALTVNVAATGESPADLLAGLYF